MRKSNATDSVLIIRLHGRVWRRESLKKAGYEICCRPLMCTHTESFSSFSARTHARFVVFQAIRSLLRIGEKICERENKKGKQVIANKTRKTIVLLIVEETNLHSLAHKHTHTRP